MCKKLSNKVMPESLQARNLFAQVHCNTLITVQDIQDYASHFLANRLSI